jgi:dTDP-4-amino-4,6-dideoxygalactose transaminase
MTLPLVPMSDPARVMRLRQTKIEAALRDVLQSGHYLLGPQVEQLEQEFANWLGISQVIGVANGTDALELALRGAKLPTGALVAIPALTASATAAAVVRAGLVPLVIDIDPNALTLDPKRLQEACQAGRRRQTAPASSVAAVVPVHLYGLPCDLDSLLDVAEEEGLVVIEDCAQSHGTSVRGRKTGTWGMAASFSCYPTKSLPALGDAGLVVTADVGMAARIRELRQYGWKNRHVSDEVGMNSRLDEIQAAVLRVHLAHLDEDNARRSEITRRYDHAFADLPLGRPTALAGASVAPHQYVVLTPSRDALQDRLAQAGIQTSQLYPVPVNDQPAYCHLCTSHGSDITPPATPAARSACAQLLCLPLHPYLTSEEVTRVIAAVRGFYNA